MADRLQCEGVADSSMCPLVLGGLIYTLDTEGRLMKSVAHREAASGHSS